MNNIRPDTGVRQLGEQRFDACHEDLTRLMANLADAPDHAVPELLGRLTEVAIAHFSEEDADLRALGGPANQCHLDEHTAVLESIAEVAALVRSRSAFDVARRLGRELVDWLPRHVDEMDLRLAQSLFLRRTGGSRITVARPALVAVSR
jgi:hemerythrin